MAMNKGSKSTKSQPHLHFPRKGTFLVLFVAATALTVCIPEQSDAVRCDRDLGTAVITVKWKLDKWSNDLTNVTLSPSKPRYLAPNGTHETKGCPNGYFYVQKHKFCTHLGHFARKEGDECVYGAHRVRYNDERQKSQVSVKVKCDKTADTLRLAPTPDNSTFQVNYDKVLGNNVIWTYYTRIPLVSKEVCGDDDDGKDQGQPTDGGAGGSGGGKNNTTQPDGGKNNTTQPDGGTNNATTLKDSGASMPGAHVASIAVLLAVLGVVTASI